MKYSKLLLFILGASLTLFSCGPKKETITIESLLKEMIDRDNQTRYPQNDFRLKQISSYNRASVSPEDSVGWFKNHDLLKEVV